MGEASLREILVPFMTSESYLFRVEKTDLTKTRIAFCVFTGRLE